MIHQPFCEVLFKSEVVNSYYEEHGVKHKVAGLYRPSLHELIDVAAVVPQLPFSTPKKYCRASLEEGRRAGMYWGCC